EQFTAWAAKRGIPETIVETLIESTPQKEDLDPEMPSPIYDLANIMGMNGEDGIPVPAIACGFLMIGSCPNGDPVAIDFKQEIGSIHYLSHEEMFGKEDIR